MAYTAINQVPSYLGKLVHQVAHGLFIGQVVALDGSGNFILALADSTVDAESVGIVSNVIDADNFVLTQAGWVYNFAVSAPFTVGSLYYLSGSNPGELDLVPGTVTLPLFYADSATSGYFLNSYPV